MAMDDIGNFGESRIGPNGVVQVKDGSFAWFESKAKLMVAETEAAGKQVFKDIVIVRVQQPGDREPVTREYRAGDERRWPDSWAAFQEKRKPTVDGTPLAILFPASEAMVKNLEGVGIHTIEQLAKVTDTGLTNIPMGLDLRNKAIAFVEARDGADGFNKLQAQLERKDEQVRSLEMQMNEMRAQMATIAAQRESDPGNNASVSPMQLTPEMIAQIVAALPQPEAKRGPGRPPKAQE